MLKIYQGTQAGQLLCISCKLLRNVDGVIIQVNKSGVCTWFQGKHICCF